METTRAIPRNVTTEMDLALWEAAEAVRSDPDSLARFSDSTPAELASEYARDRLPVRARSALAGFLRRYGMRGVGEIDLGRPRWREEPADVIATVQRYLTMPDEQAPPEVLRRGERAAREATDRLAALASAQRHGRARAIAVRFAVSRIRAMAGARESPKFTVVQVLGVAREALLASGADLLRRGVAGAPRRHLPAHARRGARASRCGSGGAHATGHRS